MKAFLLDDGRIINIEQICEINTTNADELIITMMNNDYYSFDGEESKDIYARLMDFIGGEPTY